MSGAEAAALALLGAAILGAQAAPLLAVELLADARRGRHHVAFLVLVRGRRLRSVGKIHCW